MSRKNRKKIYSKSLKKLKHVRKFQSHPQNMVFVTKSAVTHLSDLGDFLLSFWLCLSSFKWEHSIIVLFLSLLRFPGSVLLWRRTLVSFEGNARIYCLFLLLFCFLPLQRQVQGLILYRLIVEERVGHVIRLRYSCWLTQSTDPGPMMGLLSPPGSSQWCYSLLVPGDSPEI